MNKPANQLNHSAASRFLPERIVSGGQTGVDRAALDAAIQLGLAHGGYCPKGRRAEDGAIDRRYALNETPSRDYPQRTEWNVRESDATLILHRGQISAGTLLTRRIAERLGRPHRLIEVADQDADHQIQEWLEDVQPKILNVAGPRETSAPGIHEQAMALLIASLTLLKTASRPTS